MTDYQTIYEDAIGHFGLVSTARAKALGVSALQLLKLARRGKLERVGYGLYRLAASLPFQGDAPAFALAVESVGEDAMLYGESVLAFLSLAPALEDRILVATPRRLRRRLPPDVVPVRLARPVEAVLVEGVRCQPIDEAIRACRGTMMPERLRDAVSAARARGLLLEREAARLRREIA